MKPLVKGAATSSTAPTAHSTPSPNPSHFLRFTAKKMYIGAKTSIWGLQMMARPYSSPEGAQLSP